MSLSDSLTGKAHPLESNIVPLAITRPSYSPSKAKKWLP